MKLSGLPHFRCSDIFYSRMRKRLLPLANRRLLQKIVYRWHDSLYFNFWDTIETIDWSKWKERTSIHPWIQFIISIDYDSQGKMIGYIYKYNRFSNVYFARIAAFIIPTMGLFPTQRKYRTKGTKNLIQKSHNRAGIYVIYAWKSVSPASR